MMNLMEQHDSMYMGKAHTNSQEEWKRPQSASCREEDELIHHSADALADATDPVERLRLLCLSRGAGGILGLGRVLRRMDNNGSKELNKRKFFNGIKQSGLDLSDQDEEKLFQRFGSYDNGTVNIEDFINHVRPPMSDARCAIVKQAFQKMDKTGDGEITLDEIRSVYSLTAHPRYMSGEESGQLVMDRFIANFEQEGSADRKVSLEEFMNYYSGISVSIDTDCFFDLMMRQEYKL